MVLAAHAGHGTVVTVLLEHNGDVNDEQRPDGAIPLYWAAQQDKAGLVKLLLEPNADPSKGLKTLDGHVGTTPVYLARRNDHALPFLPPGIAPASTASRSVAWRTRPTTLPFQRRGCVFSFQTVAERADSDAEMILIDFYFFRINSQPRLI